MTANTLKPCPFCGSPAHIEQRGDPRMSTVYQCDDCGCRLETGEERDYGAEWNRRAALPLLPIAGEVSAPINWDDADDPVVKMFVGYDVEGYVEEYELCGDDCYYTPNESEKSLLIDAISGVVSDIHEKLRALIPSSPGKDGGQEVDAVGEQWRAIEDGDPKTSWYPVGYGDEAGWRAIANRCPDKYQIETRPVFAQPASTALVERLTKASRACGGCGATDPSQRCIGCLHSFFDGDWPERMGGSENLANRKAHDND